MPTIMLKNVAAGTANAVDGLQFQDIPEPGALVSIYGSFVLGRDRTLPSRRGRQHRVIGGCR